MPEKTKIPWIKNKSFDPNYLSSEDPGTAKESGIPLTDESTNYVPWLDPGDMVF